jgi:membrane associated rhomboid family serine protease
MSRRFQSAEVILLIAVNAAVFAYEQSLGPAAEMALVHRFAAVPAAMWDAFYALREHGLTRDVLVAAMPLVTANYLHADVAHIGMNMLFLWMFGNVVSQVAGRWLFLALYLLAGIIAVLVYVRTNPGSETPMVGASGAIAGLEGAYFVFVFRWELPPVRVWPLDGPVAPARLAFLAILNFAIDTHAFFGGLRNTTAYGAHVGGFVGGGLLAMTIATFWRPRWRALGRTDG